LLAGAAIHNTFSYMGRTPLVKYRIRRSSLQRSIANDPQFAPDSREFKEVLDRLFSLPGIKGRFGPTRLGELRRAAEASSFAIKGQEFLRHNELGAARCYFSAALHSGSRDSRDLLCWAASFSPLLLRWAAPLFGTINAQRREIHTVQYSPNTIDASTGVRLERAGVPSFTTHRKKENGCFLSTYS
jgi:hypothetical protein